MICIAYTCETNKNDQGGCGNIDDNLNLFRKIGSKTGVDQHKLPILYEDDAWEDQINVTIGKVLTGKIPIIKVNSSPYATRLTAGLERYLRNHKDKTSLMISEKQNGRFR